MADRPRRAASHRAARRHAIALTLLAGAALAGCATLPTTPVAERSYAGRFAATTVLDGRSENSTGRFTLSVAGARLILDLATPLGTTLARFETGPDGALIQVPGTGGLQEARGRNAADLSEQVLGYALPVDGIADWIDGRPAPGRPVAALGTDAASGFIQDGWRIQVAERQADGRPRRLVIARDARTAPPLAAPAPAITLRLVLDD